MKAATYDKTEQERLLIIFHCAEKYYNTKGSNTERHKALMRIPYAEWCAWSDTESQRAGCAAPRVHIEKFSTKGRDTDA